MRSYCFDAQKYVKGGPIKGEDQARDALMRIGSQLVNEKNADINAATKDSRQIVGKDLLSVLGELPLL
jgi:hypothetical protein